MNEIRELRETTGLSQRKFAEHFDIPTATLQDWEHERRKPPVYIINMIKKILEYENELKEKDNVPIQR